MSRAITLCLDSIAHEITPAWSSSILISLSNFFRSSSSDSFLYIVSRRNLCIVLSQTSRPESISRYKSEGFIALAEERKDESPDAPEPLNDLYAVDRAVMGELSLEASIFRRISVLKIGAIIHAKKKQSNAITKGITKNFFFFRQ